MPNHILWVESRPVTAEREDEYNLWYNHFHLHQVLALPGFVAATRYKLSHIQTEWYPPAQNFPAWPYGKEFTHLAIFEIDKHADPQAILEALEAGESTRQSADPENDPVAWGPQWFYESFTEREGPIALKPDGAIQAKPNGDPNHLFVVPISPVTAEADVEFNRWYMTQVNVRRPGIASSTRYKLSRLQGRIDSRAPEPEGEWPYGQHWYRTIYDMYEPQTAYDNLKASLPPPQPADSPPRPRRYSWMAPWPRLSDEHLIYEPVTYRVTPLWPK